MKTVFATVVLGLSISTVALAEPFNMGSQQNPPAVRSSMMASSGSPTADLGGFNERDAGYRHDGSTSSKAPRAEMTNATVPAHRSPGWTGPDAWNS